MEQQVKEALEKAGINIETAMNRFFDNEEMYFSFLDKFTEDDLMVKMKLLIEDNQVKEAFPEYRISMVHGKLKQAEKDEAMRKFA